MGGGSLASKSKKKGFAISGILYPLLILTLFLVVQMLFMMQNRKNVLDKAKTELADSINKANTIYNNEELSTIIDDLKNRVTTLETVIKDSEVKVLRNTDPKKLTEAGKYYILEIIDSPYGKNGYFEVEKSSDPNWRRITYKYNRGSAVFENLMIDGTWSGWKLIAGQVELWTGSVIPNNTRFTFGCDLRSFSTLRFYISNGEYIIDTALDRNSHWTGGTSGWATPNNATNEVYAIGAYVVDDDNLTIGSVNRTTMYSGGTFAIDSTRPITKIVGRP